MAGIIVNDDNILDIFLGVLSDKANTGSVLDSIRYQGFDPKVCRQKVMRVLNTPGTTVVMNDILKAIGIYIVRGTKVEKIRSKTSDAGINILNRVVDVLDIKFAPARDLKPDDLSLSRLSAAFPELVASVLIQNPDIAKTFGLPIPEHLCFPSGASLIPKTETAMFEAWKEWAFTFDKQINPRNRSLATPSAEQLNFWRVAHESSLFSDTMREKIWSKLEASLTASPGPSSRTATPLTIIIPPTMSVLTSDPTSPIKLSEIDAFYSDNSKVIATYILRGRNIPSGEVRTIPSCPNHFIKKPRIMHRLLTDCDQNAFAVLATSGVFYMAKGTELFKSEDGVPIAYDYVNRTFFQRPTNAAEVSSFRWYTTYSDTAGNISIRKLGPSV